MIVSDNTFVAIATKAFTSFKRGAVRFKPRNGDLN